jgi:sugar-specific transcriptional regulator TrmB
MDFPPLGIYNVANLEISLKFASVLQSLTSGEEKLLIRSGIVDDYVKALIRLGLSKPQARIYVALLELGSSSARQLTSVTKMDRADTYRATVDLLRLGLTEKVVGNPTRHTPLAFGDVVHLLIERRSKEDAELSANLDRLAKNSQLLKGESNSDFNQFVIIPSGQATDLKLLRLFRNAKSEILAIVPGNENLQWLLNNREDVIGALKAKKILIRIIIGGSNNVPAKITNFEPYGNFERRRLFRLPSVRFGIYDSKELCINMSANPEDKEAPCIWTNNACFVELARNYFYSVWETAET